MVQHFAGWERDLIDADIYGTPFLSDWSLCKFIEDRRRSGVIATRPCLDFDNPAAVPQYVCSGEHFSSPQEAINHLVLLGYHPTHPSAFYDRVREQPPAYDLTKPVPGGCQNPNAMRSNARVVGCGCYWTYFTTQSPEPNPELDTYSPPGPFSHLANAYWHVCHAPRLRQRPNCCTQ